MLLIGHMSIHPEPGRRATFPLLTFDTTPMARYGCDSVLPYTSMFPLFGKESSLRASLLSVLAAFAIILPSILSSLASAQEETWLDGDLASWNSPGLRIPAAPTIDGNPDPQCAERERPAETAEDDALIAEGWRLLLPYQRGWGVTLVSGLAAYDGMCRPLGYQSFVFVDGVFAGTISPEPMDSRTTGAATDVNLWYADQLSAEYVRYAPDDPLCCASETDTVNFTIEDTPDGPVLNPVPAS